MTKKEKSLREARAAFIALRTAGLASPTNAEEFVWALDGARSMLATRGWLAVRPDIRLAFETQEVN